jgi:uncharacterized protein (TIGR00369 family)
MDPTHIRDCSGRQLSGVVSCFEAVRNHASEISLATHGQPEANNGMRVLPHTHSCFVCGESNAAGLNLRFQTDGRVVQATFIPKPEHVGFKQTIHGGIISTLLDEIMVWACAVQTRRFAYCAELNVRFASPLRPGNESVATGEMVANRRNRIYEARAELRSGAGVVAASATGKYLPIKEAEAAELFEDFVGDATGLFEPGE